MGSTGLVRRLGAMYVDMFVFSIMVYPISFGLAWLIQSTGIDLSTLGLWQMVIPLLLFFYAIWFVYFAVFLSSKYGATLGKMLFKIRVVRLDESRVNFWRALVRELAKVFIPFAFFVSIFTSDNRGWHDMIAGTKTVGTGQKA